MVFFLEIRKASILRPESNTSPPHPPQFSSSSRILRGAAAFRREERCELDEQFHRQEVSGEEGAPRARWKQEPSDSLSVCGRTFRSKEAMFGHLRSHPDRKPRAPPSPGGPQAAPAGDPAAENGGTSGDTRGVEASKENGVAPQSSVAARPCRKKRTKMQRTGLEELNCGAVRGAAATTRRPRWGTACTNAISAAVSSLQGRPSVATSANTGKDRTAPPCPQPAPWGRAMDIDLKRPPPSEDDSSDVSDTTHKLLSRMGSSCARPPLLRTAPPCAPAIKS
ncbi:unnamed protein product [Spirodela intermedia]|uniref:C2H2-type domain-containing protein n=1 Tax=Spirodela intermedia TaxID=51605 RepID=A0A7I8JP31_SPIIN|nr:unnamed protein product [Spirodela intermedia]CAA6671212.1 unnamed protein product [Spirodela intermedia]